MIVLTLIMNLQNAEAVLYATKVIGTESCLGIDKIKHTPGTAWQIDSADWDMIQNDSASSLTQLSAETPLLRTVQPYHSPFTSKLAIVTCNYASGTLVLKRTYEENKSPFPEASYIAADTNIDRNGAFNSIFFNWATSCSTTMGSLDKCHWTFLQGLYDNEIPPGFYDGPRALA